tara:strand:+ start:1613 stop:2227 length:615 start_codon:yes stop_codon:yes gene_type:complete
MINNNIKILLLGGAGTGKTSILRAYYNKAYSPYPTVGVEVSSKLIYRDGVYRQRQPVRFYDMGGARHWWYWIPEYLLDCDVVFVFYDVTRTKTLSDADDILKILLKYKNDFRIIMVGNKTDKVEERELSIFHVNNMIQKWRLKDVLLTHIETNVDNIISFRKILEKIVLGVRKINTPKEFIQTEFNLSIIKKDVSWSDYIFNWP